MLAASVAGLVLGLLGLLAAEATGSFAAACVAKPLASTSFVLAAVASGAATTTHGKVLLAALALSWLGDVFLLGRSDAAFLGGLGSFLLAHLAFALSFLLRGVSVAASAAGAALLALVATFVWSWLSPHLPGKMRAPVVAYVLAIALMVSLAIGTTVARPSLLLLAGAIAFFASDLAVARDRFVAPGLANRVWGLPLYYGAQMLLAVGAAA